MEQWEVSYGDSYIPLSQRTDLWRIDATGFAANFDARWNNWDPDGLGNFLMKATSYGIGGSLLLPVASVAGPGLGATGLRSSIGHYGREIGVRGVIYYMNFNASIGTCLGGVASATATLNHRYGNQILYNFTRSRQYLYQIQNPPVYNINVNFDAANTLIKVHEIYNKIISKTPE